MLALSKGERCPRATFARPETRLQHRRHSYWHRHLAVIDLHDAAGLLEVGTIILHEPRDCGRSYRCSSSRQAR